MAILIEWACRTCRGRHKTPAGEKCKRCPHCQAPAEQLEVVK